MENGEYIFYADESGDHSLSTVDLGFPLFVLSICGFRIKDYCQRVVPAIQQFKFRHFGHDMVILHERDIRKQTNDFVVLTNVRIREQFLEELSDIVAASSFRVFAVIIDKAELKSDFFPDNPYVIALRYALEEIYRFLKSKRVEDRRYFFVFERRGAKEDLDLELEFRRITDGQNVFRIPFQGFDIRFADKRSNSTGMQLADLSARPIGLSFLRPEQKNRSIEIISKKIHKCKNVKRLRRGAIFGL